MAGLNFHHGVAQVLWHGKLFHIDLNAQRGVRYDQDLRFGSEDQKNAFFLVDLLERGGYQGPRHFDARAYRTEDADGVWEFARGCMRTYLILKDRAAAFRADPEVTAAMAAAGVPDLAIPSLGPGETLDELLADDSFDPDAAARQGRGYERLDQLAVEHLLGAR
jgi:xylose isomerase